MEAVELDLQTRWMDGAGLQEVKPTRRMYSGRPFAFTNLRGEIGANESDSGIFFSDEISEISAETEYFVTPDKL
jgi:hypothetical protein